MIHIFVHVFLTEMVSSPILALMQADLLKVRDPGDNLPGTLSKIPISQAHLNKIHSVFEEILEYNHQEYLKVQNNICKLSKLSETLMIQV